MIKRKSLLLTAFVTLFCVALGLSPLLAQPSGSGPAAWTLDEARAHLKLYPRDPYVQYVALQLARNEGRLELVSAELRRQNPRTLARNARMGQINLFSIFSGQLAIQESLQLDAMGAEQAQVNRRPPRGRTGPGPIEGTADPSSHARDTVEVSSLKGPTIKSHPWGEMLASRSPKVSGLALCVPADFYFVSFRSVDKLLDASDLALQWGAHLSNQTSQESQTQLVGERLQQQLAVETDTLLRPFYDAVVDEVALAGSDLFFREGSDVTLLFHTTQPALLRAKMDQMLSAAEQSRVGAVRSHDQYLGIDIEHVETPDRQLYVFSAYPSPETHVRSNSREGMLRVLAAIVGSGKGGTQVERLGETEEFRYVRTLLPQGADEEDGFIYLSDPFMRRMMGPKLRLTEQRRMMCYNHLRMIGHAALLHRTQTGKFPASLADLLEAGCAPGEFGKGKLACPDGGEYTLAADGLTGVCSHHGYASSLTPCLEAPTRAVTEDEAAAYRNFLQQYNRYWVQYFDPIAIRLQITPERYRAETLVLPLIDNSIYTSLARSLGEQPERLDQLPVPQRNIFSFAVRVNKAQLLSEMGMSDLIQPEHPDKQRIEEEAALAEVVRSLRQIGLAMHMYADRHNERFPLGDNKGLSWRVHLLPYLREKELYDEFHLDEPWDSPHNRALIARMPEVFSAGSDELDKQGKTCFVVPRGENTVFTETGRPTTFAGIRDGTSNTAMLLETNPKHDVIWTKPEDVTLAGDKVEELLRIRNGEAFLVAFSDASVRLLRTSTPPETIEAILTRNGGEVVNIRGQTVPLPNSASRNRNQRSRLLLTKLGMGELVTKGIGNQIGFHVYDAEPMFDLGLSRFMGQMLGSWRGSPSIQRQFLYLFPIVGALNGPVYVSIPVQDATVVDRFLERLDAHLAELARREQRAWFLSFDQDFYHLPQAGGRTVRTYAFEFGPLKWRFFWSRIGDAVYVASKQEVLDDLAAINTGSLEAIIDPDTTDEPAHALLRLRPQHWDQVLGDYRLAWEENNRKACLRNLGPLSSLSRALAPKSATFDRGTSTLLHDYEKRVYDVFHFCPDEGDYEATADGREVVCSVHGSAGQPRQLAAPAQSSELGNLLHNFRDLSVRLTFLEDGLHATVTLEREQVEEK